MTSLPFPAKTGSTCNKNQPATRTMRTTTPRTIRRSGLESTMAIYVVLQHDDRRCAVDVMTLILGLYPGLRERALGLHGRESFVPLRHHEIHKNLSELLKK